MAWGLQGRGERPCPDNSLDSICAFFYHRSPISLKRISEKVKRQLPSGAVINCVQARQNSVCWKFRN
jgi:hypothetical protein